MCESNDNDPITGYDVTNDDDDFPFVSEGTVAGLARDNKYWREKADALMQKAAQLQEENERLQLENKRLRRWIAPDVIELTDEIEQLRAEVAEWRSGERP